MRYILIDLSSDNYLQQPNLFGGYEGEHNETILQVKLPKRMIDIECSGYRFDFQTSEDNKISSPLIPISELNNDILSFHLTQQLTIAGKLLFNVIAILSDENTVSMISKTNTVTLRIEDAVDGNMQLIDPNGYKDELQKMVDERIMEINPAKVDQTYSPGSENAQSGKAVAEAVTIEQNRADNTFANALKGNKSDTAILLDDISPVTHEMGVKVRGKNLYYNSTHIFNVTDMWVGAYYVHIRDSSAEARELLCSLAGQTVSFSYMCEPFDLWDGKCEVIIWYDDTYIAFYDKSNTIPANFKDCVFRGVEFRYRSKTQPTDVAIENIKISNIQLELGSTATDYTPYVPDLTAVKVSRLGKNLFDMDGSFNKVLTGLYPAGTSYDCEVEKISSDEWRFYNLTKGDRMAYMYIPLELKRNTNYTISITVNVSDNIANNTSAIGIGFLDTVDVWEIGGIINGNINFSNTDVQYVKTFNSKNYTELWLKGYITYNAVDGDIFIIKNIQLEEGTTATEYEPYIAPTEFTPTADGTVNGVTSLYPNTTLMTDTEGVIIDCEYNRDINKAFAALEAAIATNNS